MNYNNRTIVSTESENAMCGFHSAYARTYYITDNRISLFID